MEKFWRPKQSFRDLIPYRETIADTRGRKVYYLDSEQREPMVNEDDQVDFGYMNALMREHNAFEYATLNPANLYDRSKLRPDISIATPQRDWVGDIIAPPYKVKQTEGRYLEWTPATTHRLYDNEIGTGEEPKEIEVEAVQHTYTLREYSLANRVMKRDLQNSDPPANLLETAAFALRNAQRMCSEARVLNVALSGLVPFIAAGGAWTAAGGGTPITDTINAIDQIYSRTQVRATDIVIPYRVAIHMVNTAEWIARFGGFDRGYEGPLFNIQTGLQNLGLRVHISGICALTTDQGTPSDPDYFENIIGNQVLVFAKAARPSLMMQTFMLCPSTRRDEFQRGEWGLEKKTRSIYMQIYEESTELLINANCGCRITGV